MCGVVGVFSYKPVNQTIYDGLILLQHRGQDAAGIMTCDESGRFFMRKSNGMVRDVFQERHMLRLVGNMGIGHVRYPTAGCSSSVEAQPFYVNSPYGIALAHNGNLTNADEIKQGVLQQDKRHINTTSDSEILLNVLAHELQVSTHSDMQAEDVFRAATNLFERVKGGYAVVSLVSGKGLIAFRDPHGIRPLVYGKRETKKGTAYMIASESVALESNGFELVRDIEPGEVVFIDETGQLHSRVCAKNPKKSVCIFEYVYFARPDSIVDNISVYSSRLEMGVQLAKRIKTDWPDHDIDVVIPIPDTSRTSAVELAHELGVGYREGFIKNRYIGRTFIMPGQKQRKKSVRQKLNPIDLEFKGKNVLLVDDSIVRGTTSKQIIQMARDAGAKKVYIASAAPPVRYPNVYGIDMPSVTEFVAHNSTEEEIGEKIGADRIFYQTLDDLVTAVRKGNPEIKTFDCSCFSGEYPTGEVNQAYLDKIDSIRNDTAKARGATQDVEDVEV